VGTLPRPQTDPVRPEGPGRHAGRGLRVHIAGGIAGLAQLVAERWDPIEADFQRYYTKSLPEACYGHRGSGEAGHSGRFSLRRIKALIAGLPQDSALARALDPELVGWSPIEDLLSLLIEVVDRGNRDFFAANTKEGTPQPEPIRIARRGHREDIPAEGKPVTDEAPQAMDVDAMKAFFAGSVTYCPTPSAPGRLK